MSLTVKQKRFCDEYVIDLNATRAYKAAYPRVKSDEVAASNASRMLRNAKVGAYVNKVLDSIHNRKTADAQEVMEYLSSVMRGEQKEQVLRFSGDGQQMVAEMALSTKDRLKAAELIGKRYGIFRDNVSVSGAIPVVIGGEDDLED